MEHHFSWSPPPDIMEEYITQYIIRCYDDARYDRSMIVNSSVRQITFDDLPSNARLSAYVTYVTQLGQGVQSEVSNFNTPGKTFFLSLL